MWSARNEVNEFGFSPLTLDFDSFVRFVRQVELMANLLDLSTKTH